MAVRIQRTPSSSGSNSKFTFSAWVKRGTLGALSPMFSAGSSGQSQVVFTASDELAVYDGSTVILKTNRKFRDPSSFYHIVVTLDATQSGTDKAKLYVNGVQETSFATDGRSSFSSLAKANQSGEVQDIGSDGTGNFLGLMTHVHMTDNYPSQASTFGETDSTSGIWTPKTSPSVTYGTNGFFLKFENSGAMGTDSSGNSNTFSTTSGTLTQNVDSPTNNYAVLNALSYQNGTKVAAPTNGNTTLTSNGGSAWGTLLSTMGASSGKYYCEAKLITVGSYARLGICDMSVNEQNSNSGWFVGQTSGSAQYGINSANGNLYTNAGDSAYANSFTAGDIIGIAMDLDNSKLYFSKNGTWQNSGVPTSGSTGTGAQSITADKTYGFAISGYASTVWIVNFGNGYFGTTAISSEGTNASGIGKFEYDVPAGYTALSTKGLNE